MGNFSNSYSSLFVSDLIIDIVYAVKKHFHNYK